MPITERPVPLPGCRAGLSTVKRQQQGTALAKETLRN